MREPSSAQEAMEAIHQRVMNTWIHRVFTIVPHMVRAYAEKEWSAKTVAKDSDEWLVYRHTEFALYGAGMDAVMNASYGKPLSDTHRELASLFYVGTPDADSETIATAFREYNRYDQLIAYANQNQRSILGELEAQLRTIDYCNSHPEDPRVQRLREFEASIGLSEQDLADARERRAEDEAWLQALYDKWTSPDAGTTRSTD